MSKVYESRRAMIEGHLEGFPVEGGRRGWESPDGVLCAGGVGRWPLCELSFWSGRLDDRVFLASGEVALFGHEVKARRSLSGETPGEGNERVFWVDGRYQTRQRGAQERRSKYGREVRDQGIVGHFDKMREVSNVFDPHIVMESMWDAPVMWRDQVLARECVLVYPGATCPQWSEEVLALARGEGRVEDRGKTLRVTLSETYPGMVLTVYNHPDILPGLQLQAWGMSDVCTLEIEKILWRGRALQEMFGELMSE